MCTSYSIVYFKIYFLNSAYTCNDVFFNVKCKFSYTFTYALFFLILLKVLKTDPFTKKLRLKMNENELNDKWALNE